MAATTTFDLAALPLNAQAEVTDHLVWQRESFASQQCRFFANHGFASSLDYRQHLLAEYKHDNEGIESAVHAVLLDRYKRNGRRTEDWMEPILAAHPTLLADSVMF